MSKIKKGKNESALVREEHKGMKLSKKLGLGLGLGLGLSLVASIATTTYFASRVTGTNGGELVNMLTLNVTGTNKKMAPNARNVCKITAQDADLKTIDLSEAEVTVTSDNENAVEVTYEEGDSFSLQTAEGATIGDKAEITVNVVSADGSIGEWKTTTEITDSGETPTANAIVLELTDIKPSMDAGATQTATLKAKYSNGTSATVTLNQSNCYWDTNVIQSVTLSGTTLTIKAKSNIVDSTALFLEAQDDEGNIGCTSTVIFVGKETVEPTKTLIVDATAIKTEVTGDDFDATTRWSKANWTISAKYSDNTTATVTVDSVSSNNANVFSIAKVSGSGNENKVRVQIGEGISSGTASFFIIVKDANNNYGCASAVMTMVGSAAPSAAATMIVDATNIPTVLQEGVESTGTLSAKVGNTTATITRVTFVSPKIIDQDPSSSPIKAEYQSEQVKLKPQKAIEEPTNILLKVEAQVSIEGELTTVEGSAMVTVVTKNTELAIDATSIPILVNEFKGFNTDGYAISVKNGNTEVAATLDVKSTNPDIIKVDSYANKNIKLSLPTTIKHGISNLLITAKDADRHIGTAVVTILLENSIVRPILYDDLYALYTDDSLIPGQEYRITDYATTTSMADTQSAGHDFDIIVTAVSQNTLSEYAKAVTRSTENPTTGYFANSDLSSWEIKYDIKNDANTYAWADTTNGKGVIYYMKDENGNECSYDFKNIKFKPIKSDWTKDTECIYTFCAEGSDASLKQGSIVARNTIDAYYNANALTLNNIAFIGVTNKDNQIDSNCHDITINDGFYNSVIDYGCYKIYIDGSCNNTLIDSDCYEIKLGNGCQGNNIGEDCTKISFSGHNSQFNKISDYSTNITLGAQCKYNEIDSNCSDITLTGGQYGGTNHNTIGGYSNSITLGADSQYNTFGSFCSSIELKQESRSNTFGNQGNSILLGEKCKFNTFGENTTGIKLCSYSESNEFGNSCDGIKLGVDSSGDIISTGQTRIQCNKFGPGCKNMTVEFSDSNGYDFKYNTFNSCSYPSGAPFKFTQDKYANWESSGSGYCNHSWSNRQEETTSVISKKYTDLKYLQSYGHLVPGQQYRITDFVTTTNTSDTSIESANNQFDIIVTATSANSFNENAKAAKHIYAEGETPSTYFNNSNLDKWEIKYDINNDTSVYTWADTTNGKGVIYYMKDEFDNECSYDFKNIKFQPINKDSWTTSGNKLYTFASDTTANNTDLSLSASNNISENVIKAYRGLNGKYMLNNINFVGANSRGNNFASGCYGMFFGKMCVGNKFDIDCKYNYFGNAITYNTFESGCNKNIFYNGTESSYITYNRFTSGTTLLTVGQETTGSEKAFERNTVTNYTKAISIYEIAYVGKTIKNGVVSD